MKTDKKYIAQVDNQTLEFWFPGGSARECKQSIMGSLKRSFGSLTGLNIEIKEVQS